MSNLKEFVVNEVISSIDDIQLLKRIKNKYVITECSLKDCEELSIDAYGKCYNCEKLYCKTHIYERAIYDDYDTRLRCYRRGTCVECVVGLVCTRCTKKLSPKPINWLTIKTFFEERYIYYIAYFRKQGWNCIYTNPMCFVCLAELH